MDELLVGHEGGNKEVGNEQEGPHLNPIVDCACPRTTNKYINTTKTTYFLLISISKVYTSSSSCSCIQHIQRSGSEHLHLRREAKSLQLQNMFLLNREFFLPEAWYLLPEA